MFAVPIIVVILSAAASLIGARAGRRIIPQRSSIILIVCVTGVALLLARAEWTQWLARGVAGDRAMLLARYIGASGLLFIAGSRMNLKEAWDLRRATSLIVLAGLLAVAVAAIALIAATPFSRAELMVAIVAVAATSQWLPCVSRRKVSRIDSISGGAAAATTLLIMVLLHLDLSVDFLAKRSAPWTAYATVAAFELGKMVMFFATAGFAASKYIERSGAQFDRARILIGYLLIAVLAFAFGFAIIGPFAALAWCYVAGVFFSGTKTGAKLARAELHSSAALLLSLAFIPIALQSHGRTSANPGLVAAVVLAAIALKFVAALAASRFTGLDNRQSLSLSARIVSPGEIAPVVLWLGMSHWLIGGDAYFAVLLFTLLSTFLGQAVRLFLRKKTPAASNPKIRDEAGNDRKSRRGARSAGAAAVLLLTLTAIHSARAQSVSSGQDPVARTMEQIKESVDARASDADRVLAAHKLIEKSNASLKNGQNEDSAESFAQAIDLLDQSLGTREDPLIESYRMKVLNSGGVRRRSNGHGPSARPYLAPLSPFLPKTVLLRFSEYRERLAPILAEESLPPQLLAVALVESGFNPFALSPKGARGIWQFMPSTARRYGLPVLPGDDRRTHPEESTRAAAKYLRDLYSRFGDWKLALAAYNSGEQRVDQAIAKSGSRIFEELARYLPVETRNYVPAVLAAWSRLTPPTGTGGQPGAQARPKDTSGSGTVFALTSVQQIDDNGGQEK